MSAPLVFRDVTVSLGTEHGSPGPPLFSCPLDAHVTCALTALLVRFVRAQPGPEHAAELLQFQVTQNSECARAAPAVYLFAFFEKPLYVRFASPADCESLHLQVVRVKASLSSAACTEKRMGQHYFTCYSLLYHKPGPMEDFIPTLAYRQALIDNEEDFEDAVVLEVGCGTGILSHFAEQSGARKVYAVEASGMAHYAQMLVQANARQERIEVISGKIEEIQLPEKVDVIISEPMGLMLFHGRMMETYLHARKWLRPGGVMFPAHASLLIAPFSDEELFSELFKKADYFNQNYYGVDLKELENAVLRDIFSQAIVGTFETRVLIDKPVRHNIDFLKANEKDLHQFEVPFRFKATESKMCHGLAFWFDVTFIGKKIKVELSTSPAEPPTRWKQVRGLLVTPISVEKCQYLTGRVKFLANKFLSYDVTMEMTREGTTTSSSNTFHLQNVILRH